MKRLLSFLCLLPAYLFGQSSAFDSLDIFINKLVIDYKIPGLAIGIIKDNKIVFNKGYGVISTSDTVTVTSQTVFPILSCTKAFTAAALGLLVDEGKVGWDDKVITYLPSFRLSDSSVTKEITITDLLSHRSGLEAFEGDLLWYQTKYSSGEILARIRFSPLRNQFRKKFGYQNVMYLAAGMIIEQVTGKKWSDFIQEKIFSPLSMTQSSTSIMGLTSNNSYARPHIRNMTIQPVSTDNIAPAGAVNSNITDMLAWMQMWLNEGRFQGKEILTKKNYQVITTPKIAIAEDSPESYGLGWFIDSDKGTKVLSHGGGMPGYKSTVMLLPELKSGVVILTNKISYVNEVLAGLIIDYLQTGKINPVEDHAYLKNFRFSWDDIIDTSQLKSFIPDLMLYQGIYEDSAYGKAIIEQKNNVAYFKLLPAEAHLSGNLYFENTNTFKVIFNDPFLPAGIILFQRDENGKIKGFKMDVPTGDFHFRYLNFIKQ